MQNIGKIIKLKLKEKGISVSEFARRINTNRNNVYDIFHRDSIDTKLLQKISEVLEYDFFQAISENKQSKEFVAKEPSIIYTKDLQSNQQQIIELQKELAYLKEIIADKNRIIDFLEDKLKNSKKENAK